MGTEERRQELAALAGEQYGIWTRAQVRAAGISWNQEQSKIQAGEWVLVHGRVLRNASTPNSYRRNVMEAALAFNAVASHRTAAALYGVGGIRPAEIEVSKVTGRGLTVPGVIVHRPRYLPDEDIATFHGIRVTTPARTAHDLGAVVGPKVVKRAVDDIINKQLGTFVQLQDHLVRWGRHGRGGTRSLRLGLAAFEQQGVTLESDLEEELVKLLEREGFEGFKTQQKIVTPAGAPIGRVDVLFPERKVVVEALGYEWHSSLVDFLRDNRRRNELEALGYTVIAFLWDDVLRPRAFVRVLRTALGD